MSDDTRPDPRIDMDGVGRCPEDESCCQYDGKRCALMGFRPTTICEPWVQWLSRAYLEGREEIRLLSESTYCAYCGEKFPLDNAAAEQVAEHIRTCTKHPMRAAESEVARLREEVAEGERKLGTARALLPIQDGRPVSQGALNALLSQRDTAWAKLDEANKTIRQIVDGYYSEDLRKADLRAEAAEARLSEERATSARLRGLLGDLEWEGCPSGEDEYDFGCPCCKVLMGRPHAPDCRLAAALKEKDHG